MTLKEFALDGRNMTSVEEFCKEVENVLAPSLSKMGRNLHAFRHVLRDGFGAFTEGEQIQVRILYKKRMKKNLQEGFVRKIFKILEETENVVFLKGQPPEEVSY